MRLTHLSCILLLGSSCVGTEIGNPPTPADAQVSVDVVGVDNAPPAAIPIALTVSDDIEVERAVILVGDLRFRRTERCAESGADHTDSFVAELLTDDVELTDIELPAGSYCGLDILPRRGGEEGFASEYPELRGLTAYAEGTYRGTPFVARRESDDEIEFMGDIELPPGNQLLFVAVDIPLWFDGLDFTAAEVDDEGRIVIGHDGSYEEAFKQNFERSIDVALDANGDNKLTAEDEDHEGDEHEDDDEVEDGGDP